MGTYLTEDTAFFCVMCGARFGACDNGGDNVTVRGKKVLTAGAKLDISGMRPQLCPFNAASPYNCLYVNGSARLLPGGRDSACKSAGSALLTDSCKFRCPKGGIITVDGIGVSRGLFLQGNASAAAGEGHKGAGDAGAAAASAAVAGVSNEPQAEEGAGDGTAAGERAKKESEPLRKEELPKILKCRQCDKSDGCDTFQELRARAIDNSSGILGKNYNKAIVERVVRPLSRDQFIWRGHKAHLAYMAAQEEEKRAGEKWRYAAHHILCGNQAVGRNRKLLALCNAFGYDVNNADNCIWLLGKSKDVSFQGLSHEEKSIHKYKCMAHGRLQWHGGSHEYRINKELTERIAARLRTHKRYDLEKIKCYAQLLAEELTELVERWESAPCSVCPKKSMDNGQESVDKLMRDAFIADMNRLAERIRKELAEFSEKPHRSYPWYVSMHAWLYAFDLLHTNYIIAVTRSDDNVLLEKFKLSRYGDTLLETGVNLKIERQGCWIFPGNPVKDDVDACLSFCDGVQFFAVEQGIIENGLCRCLGFETGPEFVFPLEGSSAAEELCNRQTELMVWIGGGNADSQAGACGVRQKRRIAAYGFFNILA